MVAFAKENTALTGPELAEKLLSKLPPKYRETFEEVMDDIQEDINTLVEDIHEYPEIHKDYYIEYAEVIRDLGNGVKTSMMIVTIAMLKAGAKADGIIWAENLLNEGLL